MAERERETTEAEAAVAARVEALLARSGLSYTVLAHAPIRSAEHAALLRGTPLEIGGKALVMKLERLGFAVVVVGGDRRLDGRALRAGLGIQRYRFARLDELRALTGLAPGGVPPFGAPVFDLPLIADAALLAQGEIAFTLGSPSRSVRMGVVDWSRVARPARVVALSAPPG